MNLVYVVYLNAKKWIFQYRAELADPEDIVNLEGWKNRFRRLVWKSDR